MEPAPRINAEQFDEQRFELPEGGSWTELVAGKIVALSPPDDAHGNIIRNLSRSLAIHAQESQLGYACFELGLIVRRGPDTVRFPAACYFTAGERFSESDKFITEACPALVIEIASSKDRRRDIEERVRDYLEWGVALVWVIEPIERRIRTFTAQGEARSFGQRDAASAEPVIPGFSQSVSALFEEPHWW